MPRPQAGLHGERGRLGKLRTPMGLASLGSVGQGGLRSPQRSSGLDFMTGLTESLEITRVICPSSTQRDDVIHMEAHGRTAASDRPSVRETPRRSTLKAAVVIATEDFDSERPPFLR